MKTWPAQSVKPARLKLAQRLHARQAKSMLRDVAALYALVSHHSQLRVQSQAELCFRDHVLNLERCVVLGPT